jgi:hypothetical protein
MKHEDSASYLGPHWIQELAGTVAAIFVCGALIAGTSTYVRTAIAAENGDLHKQQVESGDLRYMKTPGDDNEFGQKVIQARNDAGSDLEPPAVP